MVDYLNRLNISPNSFWLGFLTGLLFAWIFSRIIKNLPSLIKAINSYLIKFKESLSTGNDVWLRNDIYRFTQKQHIIASIFSLDEISIEPKVLTPMIQTSGSIDSALTDSVSLSIPYTPDWPELATVYGSSTMGLLEALQGNSNIILAGHPGSGKSVALAWLSACITKNIKGLGKLSGLLPIYVHVTDIPNFLDRSEAELNDSDESVDMIQSGTRKTLLDESIKADSFVNLLIQAISNYVSPTSLTRLAKTIYQALENDNAILILDGVDELPPANARLVTEYIRVFFEKYSTIRVIVSMSYDDLAGLPAIGFNLLGMAGWTEADQVTYLKQWNQHWIKWMARDDRFQTKHINPFFLRSWLSTNNTLLTPMEFALKVWAAYIGDIRGTDGPSSIDTYVRRMTEQSDTARLALEQFSLYLLSESCITAATSESEHLISLYKSELKSSAPDKSNSELEAPEHRTINVPQLKRIPDITSLSDNGFLKASSGSKFGLLHPVITGYLAGHALSMYGILDQQLNQPSWVVKNLAFYYLAHFSDVSFLLQHYLQDDDKLYTNHLLVSRWLQVAPPNMPWRTIVLRRLTTLLQKERNTPSLSAKFVSALLFSKDAGVSIYFRQLLKNDHQSLKHLAALGSGVLEDQNAIDELNLMLQEQSPASIRCACLALGSIGDKRSLEILAFTLLNGSETARRYAAEALANNKTEGYQALNEGSTMQDLLVRRSVIFGLIRIDQPWARKIVENLQLEDSEWVVRNAAIQAFDEIKKRSNYAPMKAPDLPEIQWLVEYASRNNTSVAPGNPGYELIKKALISGKQDEKLLALDFYRTNCDQNSLVLVYNTYKNSENEIRDSAYYVLWVMTLAGLHLPLSFE